MTERVAVVGAGIVGIAHAWQEARLGAQVTLFERDQRAQGASVRNFGMVWPIGQPNGPLHHIALRSRELWTEFLDDAGLWSDPCGSLHVACRPDEWEVLQEFADLAPALEYECELLGPEEVERRSAAVKRGAVLGGMSSPTEMCVNPRQVIARAPGWLQDRWGVEICMGTRIVDIDLPKVRAMDGREWHFDRVTVAGGVDSEALYPDIFRRDGLTKCKLQMMRTVAQPGNWRMGTLLASGLTLRHYANFRVCSGLKKLRERVAAESPELDRYGIHVMAAQNGEGEVILGDSHEYGEGIGPFDKERIHELILLELRRFIDLPDWSIAERWHGVYAALSGEVQFVRRPSPGVTLVVSTGGAGMTMSFGLAEDMVRLQAQNGQESPPEMTATLH
jgi:FAD dependent oxidoreductase TIGR03364